MNISDVAKQTGLTNKAIRFYEDKGLITPPSRADNGYRIYHDRNIEELSLLRQARLVGFNLEECKELLMLFHNQTRRSADVKAQTMKKIAEIEQHIAELNSMKQRLAELVELCPGDDSAECPIINGLTHCCHKQ